jgi:DNA mismatch repair protein MutS
MAIAQAVIEHLHDVVGCKTLVSTHFHELAHLEDSLQHLKNYRMAVKESGTDITFLRKLVPGAASTSYGIYCAQIAGLPSSIITRAYTLLNEDTPSRTAVQQLSFFEPEMAKPVAIDPMLKQIMDEITELDIMATTPMQAMLLVDRWKKSLKG